MNANELKRRMENGWADWDRLSKADAFEGFIALVAKNPGEASRARRMNKAELVAELVVVANEIRAAKQAAEEAEELKRLAKVAEERAAGNVAALMEQVAKAFERRIGEYEEVLEEFKKQAAANPVYALDMAELVYLAQAMVRNLLPGHEFAKAQAAEQTQTLEQILREYSEDLEGFMRAVFESGYRHNSTDAMRNLKNMNEFKAAQKAAMFFQNLLRICGKVLTGEYEVQEASRVRDSRW